MSKDEFILSIVIPTYNRSGLLEKTLDSIQAQSYGRWECIVVDDGSTDHTAAVVQKLQAADTRFKYLTRPADAVKGAPSCRNIGLAHAQGTYVMFFDSDDLLPATALANRMEVVQHNPDYDFWVFQTIRCKERMGDDTHIWNSLERPHSEDIPAFLGINPVWHTSGPVFSKKFLETNHLHYTEGVRSWQDWEFHLRVLLLSPHYYKCGNPKAAAYQRFHAQRAINKEQSDTIHRDRLDTCFMLIEEFQKAGQLSADIQRQFFKVCYFIMAQATSEALHAAHWKQLAAKLPAIGRLDVYFWRRYLVHQKHKQRRWHYKKKNLLEMLKERYFYKRFPVDDFSNRTWYKNTLT